MNNLVKNLNSLSVIRKKITNKKTISQLAEEIKLKVKLLCLDAKNDDLKITNLSGLYYIEAKFKFKTIKALDDFGTKWGKYRSKAPLPVGVSRYYVSRAKKHEIEIQKNEYIPFYLGKAENIYKRIIEHLEGSDNSDTYSLKLRSRPDIIKDVNFKISYYEFKINSDAYFGIEPIEKALREVYNPIIGKQ